MRRIYHASEWENYLLPPSFVLGFHGCDKSVGEKILAGKLEHLTPSENDYDWLGSGIYFWESNPQRALQFAEERAAGRPVSRGDIRKPFVIGAIINLGLCLDLNNSSALDQVQQAHDDMRALFQEEGIEMPENAYEMKVRRLDCAVFNFLHGKRAARRPRLRSYDTVRGTFREGQSLYSGTDICRHDHIQICVRNPISILGYFRPIKIRPTQNT